MSNARYWVAVLYPESLSQNWAENVSREVQVPFAYCIHDKDVDKNGEIRKKHLHLMLAFPNTTTYKHALETFKRLAPTCSTCEKVINVRFMYDYLIHDTDECKKQKKHVYKNDERVTGNDFDIGAFEQLSVTEKNKQIKELANLILENNFTDYATFYSYVMDYGQEDYFEILKSYAYFFTQLCKGNFHKIYKK